MVKILINSHPKLLKVFFGQKVYHELILVVKLCFEVSYQVGHHTGHVTE